MSRSGDTSTFRAPTGTGSVRRVVGRILPLGLPLAVGYMAQISISFTDAALVARSGSEALAGVTLAVSLFSLVMLFGLGLVTAVAPKVAASHQASAADELRGWAVQGAWLALLAGALGIVVLLNTEHILVLMGQNPGVAAIAQDYNNGAAAGLPFFLLYVNARCLMTGVGRPKPATWIMLAAVPLNLVLGYSMIFGVGRLPGLGVFGAGLASSVVRMFASVLVGVVLLRGRTFRELDLRAGSPAPRPPMLLELGRVGAWIGVRILLGEGFLPVLAFFVARHGAHAVSAHAVALRLESLIVVFALGFSSAATAAAAWAHEEKDWRALRDLRTALLLIGLVYSLVLSSAVTLCFHGIVRDVFGIHDRGTQTTLSTLLPLLIVYIVVDTLVTMPMGYLVGLSDTRVPTAVVAAGNWILGLGSGAALSEFTPLGFYGLWLGAGIGTTCVTAFCFARAGQHIKTLRKSVVNQHD